MACARPRPPQAPGLPYQLPRQVAGYPVLTGRAVVELTVEKADGERVFIDPNRLAEPTEARLTCEPANL